MGWGRRGGAMYGQGVCRERGQVGGGHGGGTGARECAEERFLRSRGGGTGCGERRSEGGRGGTGAARGRRSQGWAVFCVWDGGVGRSR